MVIGQLPLDLCGISCGRRQRRKERRYMDIEIEMTKETRSSVATWLRASSNKVFAQYGYCSMLRHHTSWPPLHDNIYFRYER